MIALRIALLNFFIARPTIWKFKSW